jgi:transcriptional regulator with XRE-family HTH domain
VGILPMKRRKGPNPVDIEVGRRIRLQRMNAGMSQTELGDKVGVTFQQIQKYEKGKNRVGAGRLTQIASVLHVPIGVFFDGATEASQSPGESPAELLTRPHALRLLQAYSTIESDKVRLSILNLVEALSDQRLS